MSGAGAALRAAAIAALQGIAGIGKVFAGPPIQAALPHAVVECGPEANWSHKSGTGRKLRLAVTLRAGGESLARAEALTAAVEATIAQGLAPAGWQLVSLHFLRSRCFAQEAGGQPGWAVLHEYRARMLAAEG
ncbi:MAG TPA: DUF3168 domain-containing protein [Allosphingosinicella sp.]|jgi:hypothetical protein